MDSRVAQTLYEAHHAAALLQWRQEHHKLQEVNAAASQAAALQGGVE